MIAPLMLPDETASPFESRWLPELRLPTKPSETSLHS
jgi:hypothetical protein